MKKLLLLAALLVGFPAFAADEWAVESVEVQSGAFREASCDKKPLPMGMDPCVCNASIVAAKTGNEALDPLLLQIAEENKCAGESAFAQNGSKRETTFTVTRNNETLLGIVYEHTSYEAGAPHARTSTGAVIYDKVNKALIEQSDILSAPARSKVAQEAKKILITENQAKYGGMLWPGEIDPSTFFSNGCEGCVLFPVEEGWVLRFMPYVVGPAAAGQVDVPIREELVH